MTRTPAMWATAFALALINLGVATTIVAAMGSVTFAPAWIGLVLVLAGALAATVAVRLWRAYLFDTRGRGGG